MPSMDPPLYMRLAVTPDADTSANLHPKAQNTYPLMSTSGAGIFIVGGCPSIRAKALSRTKISWPCRSTASFAREVEDQDSGNLTLNHPAVDPSFHQPSIRPKHRP